MIEKEPFLLLDEAIPPMKPLVHTPFLQGHSKRSNWVVCPVGAVGPEQL